MSNFFTLFHNTLMKFIEFSFLVAKSCYAVVLIKIIGLLWKMLYFHFKNIHVRQRKSSQKYFFKIVECQINTLKALAGNMCKRITLL